MLNMVNLVHKWQNNKTRVLIHPKLTFSDAYISGTNRQCPVIISYVVESIQAWLRRTPPLNGLSPRILL